MCVERPAAGSQRTGLSPETRRRLLRAGAATVAASLYITPRMRTTRLAAAAACLSPAGVQLDASIDRARCDLVQGRIILRNHSAAQRVLVQEISAVLTFGGAARAVPEFAPVLPAGADVLLRPGVAVQPGQTAATAVSLNPAGRAGADRTAVALTVTIRYDAGSIRLECSAAASGSLECHQEGNGGGGGGNGSSTSSSGSGSNGGGGNAQGSQQQSPSQAVPPPVVPSGGGMQPVASPPGQAVQGAPQPQVSVLPGAQPEAAPLPEMQVSPESIGPAPEVSAPPAPVAAPPSVPAPAQVPPLAVPLPAAAAPPPAPAPGPPLAGPQAAGPSQAAAPQASPASQPSVTLPRAGSSASSPAGGVRVLGLGSLLLALGRLLRRLAGRHDGAHGACRSDSSI